MDNSRCSHQNVGTVCKVLLAALSSWACVCCLNFDAEIVIWLVLFALEFIAFRRLEIRQLFARKSAFCVISIFSCIFAIGLTLGDHIVVPVGGAYGALVDESYIAPYHLRDLAFFILMLPGLFALFAAPIQFLLMKRNGSRCFEPCMDALNICWVFILSAIVFLGWVPYLVVYWPGFIFGDSLSSLNQAMGAASLSNHHPVAYTIYLKFWLKLAGILGLGNTIGIGLSSICQSVLMSLVFGLLARWVVVRGDFHWLWGVGLALVFSLTPYIATYGMALWKDPLFSSAVVVFSICFADFVWSKGGVSKKKSWVALLVISAVAMAFLRNNGIFILVGMIAVLTVFYMVEFRLRRPSGFISSIGCMVVVLFIYGVVTGPIYSCIGVMPSETAESIGIPLNQMARVAALDGDMSESDREYLDSILPFDEYRTTYTPCCTDSLKWAPDFDNSVLKEGLWGHWLSMFVKNPNVYFQAWELQTYGFWVVNPQNSDWLWFGNIGGGVPRNVNPSYVSQLSSYGIEPNPAALDEGWNEVLPYDSWSIPVSWLFWMALYLSICMLAAGKGRWIISLLPSLLLVGTLVIASPIYYWPRYGAALQFLMPMYVLLFMVLFGKPKCASSHQSPMRHFS